MNNHPARYCLVELVNIHDPGLEFEGIHRVIFNLESAKLMDSMKKWFASNGSTVTTESCASAEEAIKSAKASSSAAHKIAYVDPSGVEELWSISSSALPRTWRDSYCCPN